MSDPEEAAVDTAPAATDNPTEDTGAATFAQVDVGAVDIIDASGPNVADTPVLNVADQNEAPAEPESESQLEEATQQLNAENAEEEPVQTPASAEPAANVDGPAAVGDEITTTVAEVTVVEEVAVVEEDAKPAPPPLLPAARPASQGSEVNIESNIDIRAIASVASSVPQSRGGSAKVFPDFSQFSPAKTYQKRPAKAPLVSNRMLCECIRSLSHD